MGVYIKGMRMPKNCSECISSDLRTVIKCTEWTEISAGRRENERAWSCPLVNLGKHGDLIDRDACVIYCIDNDKRSWEALAYAEPVVEREDET